MTAWLTLHGPVGPPLPDTYTTDELNARMAAIEAVRFHIRADTIVGIYPSEGETVVRLQDGAQVVCQESAERVLTMVRLAEERTYTMAEIIASINRVLPPPRS